MSAPENTLWEIEPHTKAKHQILRRYLGAWFGILGPRHSRIIYLDGFSGPGRYQNGECGSPIIAIEIALSHNEKERLQEVIFVFVEEREDRFFHLKNEIQLLNLPKNFHIHIQQNEFENSLEDILDELSNQGERIAPTFAFIDPFGFKGAPFYLIERLLANDKTEVFINFMIDAVNRFLDHRDDIIRQHIIQLLGTNDIEEILNCRGGVRIDLIRDRYYRQLRTIANFVRYFEMRDQNNRRIYYLFFATNNRLGHVKIKEAFWHVDNQTGYRFSDATNPNQLVLFEIDPFNELSEILSKKFEGETKLVEEIRLFVEDKTPYITTHMKKSLCHLESAGRICVKETKQDGKKRRGNSFPDEVIVTFFPSTK